MALIIIIFSTLCILGWLFQIPLLKGEVLNSPASRLNSLLLFLVIGGSLLLLKRPSSFNINLMVSIIGLFIFLVGFFTTMANITDTSIFSIPGLEVGSRSLSSFNFILFGGALFLFSRKIYFSIAQIFSFLAGLIGYMGLMIYLFGAAHILSSNIYSLMAIYSAILHTLVALSLLSLYPQEGIIRILHENRYGSYMARKMLPVSLLAVTLIGISSSFLVEALGFRANMGEILIMVMVVGFLFPFILWTAHYLNTLHHKQQVYQQRVKIIEGFYEDTLEGLLEGVLVTGGVNEIIYYNSHMQELFPELDKHVKELNDFFQDRIPELKSYYHKSRKDMVPSYIPAIKTREKFLSGWIIPQINEGVFNGSIITLSDVTKQKEAELVRESSLKEKELLLGEIHHRVKNNMQIISSLLRLQGGQFTQEDVKEAFNESQNRIKTMALVHETLYQSDSFSQIALSLFIQKLINGLLSTFQPHGGPIRLESKLDPVKLGIDQCIPLGLVLNELVTNSFKHAFPHKKEGTITVILQKEDHKIILKVKDDGVGLQNRKLEDAPTLGLTLIKGLSEQLDADLHFESNNGLEVEISFQETGYDERI